MVKGSLYGVMEKNMKELGKIIKCMGMENLNGQMVDHIKDNIKMI